MAQLEEVLASHVVDLATEIRRCDAADLISLIWLDRTLALRDLINSGCETVFRPECMIFNGGAEVVAPWAKPPIIGLPMEFRAKGFEIYYRLTMTAASAFVEIDLLRFDGSEGLTTESVGLLDSALTEARRLRPV